MSTNEHVLDLRDRGLFSADEIAVAFRAYCRIPPDAVLLTGAQRDALRAEIGEGSTADTIWGVEMLVAPEAEVIGHAAAYQLPRPLAQYPNDEDLRRLGMDLMRAFDALGVSAGGHVVITNPDAVSGVGCPHYAPTSTGATA